MKPKGLPKSKKDYYQNKILYALSKVDYSMAKMSGKKADQTKPLSTLYFVLMNYKEIDLKTLMKLTKLSRDEVVPKLRQLKEWGIVDWSGRYLSQDKDILVRKDKPGFAKWIMDLKRSMKKKGIDMQSKDFIIPDVEDEEEPVEKKAKAETLKSDQVVIELETGIELTKAKAETLKSDQVVIELETGIELTITKDKLKKMVAERLGVSGA